MKNSSQYFQDYTCANEDAFYEQYRNAEGNLTRFDCVPSVIMINTDLIGDIEINGYADLLNPELKGKIVFADPQASSSSFEHLVNMLYAMGTDGQEVVVGIRPEEFSVSSERLTCDVLNRTFLGRYSNCFLHFADGMCVPDQPSIEFSQDLGHTQTLYQPGDHLTLRPNPDKINVFTADMEKSLLKDVIRYEQA